MIKINTVLAAAMLWAIHMNATCGTPACPVAQAIRAESALSNMQKWDDAIVYYKQYKACLDGGISEGFTDFLATKLAEDAGPRMFWEATRHHRWFRSIVATRMQSEIIPLQTTESILQNLYSQCPSSAKTFCQKLHHQIVKSCPACKSNQ